MATTYTLSTYQDVAVSEHNRVIERLTPAQDFTVANGDIFKAFKLPRGAKILGGTLIFEELDEHATPTGTIDLYVTDGSVTKTIIDGESIAAADVVTEATATTPVVAWAGYVTTDQDFYVAAKIMTAVAQAKEGSLQIGIRYTMDVESGELG